MSDVLRDRIQAAGKVMWEWGPDEPNIATGYTVRTTVADTVAAVDAVLRAAATEIWWCQDDNGDGYVQHPPIKAHPQPPVYCYFGGARNHRQGCGPRLLVDPAHLAGSDG